MDRKYSRPDLEPACFYLRKSREDQEAEARGEGETLAKHKKALFRLAHEYDINIARVYEEIVSGESLIHRPAMLTLLKEVADGAWRSVLCMDIDRLGRGGMQDQGLILETFKNTATLIVTPRKIYNLNDEFDEEYTEFEAFMARKELKIITRRLQGGRRRSAEEGNYIGAKPPYGYLVSKGTTGRTLIPHPDQAPVVQLIFELYTQDDPALRMGTCKIAKELNRLGKTTYTGKLWEPSTVLSILKNEVYFGRLQWRKEEAKKAKAINQKTANRPREEWIDVAGKHQPLVAEETFRRAQIILKGKYHIPYQLVNGMTNPLAGLVKCAVCGISMVYRPYPKQKAHLICRNPHCSTKSSRFEYVERELLDGLSNWLYQYRAQWDKYIPPPANDKLMGFRRQALQNLNKDLKALEQQKDQLHELLERGIYDGDTYCERLKKLTERIKTAAEAVKETEGAINCEITREQARQDIIPKVEKLLTLYSMITDPALKNRMLQSVLEYATYRKDQRQQGDDFILVLYPRLPS